MSRKLIAAAVALAAVFSLQMVGAEDAPQSGEKAEFKACCPVSGKPADKEQAVDYKGGKVYFCCPGCPGAFQKDTAGKFAAKANHQLAGTGQAKEVKCPLTGRPLNPATAIKVSGVQVAFCCDGCKGKASKIEGDEQVKLIFSDAAFAKGYEVEAKKAEQQ